MRSRLISAKAIGRLSQAARSPWVAQEAERLIHVDVARGDLPAIDELLDDGAQSLRTAEGKPYGEHHQDADAPLHRRGKDPSAGRLVQHVEANHHYIPHVVLERPLQHPVLGIGIEGLGDPDEADLALLAQLLERRHDAGEQALVIGQRHTVQVVDVDGVGPEAPQAPLQAQPDIVGCQAIGDPFLRREDHRAAVDAADSAPHDLLSAIRLRGIDEVDTQLERPAHDGHRLRLASAGPLPHPAGAPSPQPHHANLQTSASKYHSVQCSPLSNLWWAP